jgi:hypothetical protein
MERSLCPLAQCHPSLPRHRRFHVCCITYYLFVLAFSKLGQGEALLMKEALHK